MKDHSWLAVFSMFTLVVGSLFTYGNGAQAQPDTQPVQVYIVSTSTSPIAVPASEPQPITVTLPEITVAPPHITVNVSIATSSLAQAPQASSMLSPSPESDGSSYTYYVTNNTYGAQTSLISTTTEAIAAADTVTLTIQSIYDATTTPIESGQTVLELLTSLDSIDPALALTTQDYGEMGVLVTAMGGLTNGTDDAYWQYMVNGVSPMIGADQYELAADDIVVWEFKSF